MFVFRRSGATISSKIFVRKSESNKHFFAINIISFKAYLREYGKVQKDLKEEKKAERQKDRKKERKLINFYDRTSSLFILKLP